MSQQTLWTGPARLRDRAIRAAYWFGFRIMRSWWFLRRPPHRGALIAVWVEDRVLVQHLSYRVHLNLPGGGVHPGERPIDAARRELREEMGIDLPESALRIGWEGEAEWDFRRDHVTIFEAELPAVPPLALDGREVVEARLLNPLAVLAGPQAPFVEAYLLQRLAQAASRQ